METTCKLKLHEAIVIALININKTTYSATYAQIAAYIDKHHLYNHDDNKLLLEEQVMLRTTKSGKHYAYLFEPVNLTTIKLVLKPK